MASPRPLCLGWPRVPPIRLTAPRGTWSQSPRQELSTDCALTPCSSRVLSLIHGPASGGDQSRGAHPSGLKTQRLCPTCQVISFSHLARYELRPFGPSSL